MTMNVSSLCRWLILTFLHVLGVVAALRLVLPSGDSTVDIGDGGERVGRKDVSGSDRLRVEEPPRLRTSTGGEVGVGVGVDTKAHASPRLRGTRDVILLPVPVVPATVTSAVTAVASPVLENHPTSLVHRQLLDDDPNNNNFNNPIPNFNNYPDYNYNNINCPPTPLPTLRPQPVPTHYGYTKTNKPTRRRVESSYPFHHLVITLCYHQPYSTPSPVLSYPTLTYPTLLLIFATCTHLPLHSALCSFEAPRGPRQGNRPYHPHEGE